MDLHGPSWNPVWVSWLESSGLCSPASAPKDDSLSFPGKEGSVLSRYVLL